MEELHRRLRQRIFAGPLEASQKIKFDTRQAATRPIDSGHDSRGSAVCVNQLRVEDELVMVAHDATATEFAEDLDDGIRPQPQRHHVAKTDDLVHADSADIATSFA
jgi:hypothetical protein